MRSNIGISINPNTKIFDEVDAINPHIFACGATVTHVFSKTLKIAYKKTRVTRKISFLEHVLIFLKLPNFHEKLKFRLIVFKVAQNIIFDDKTRL